MLYYLGSPGPPPTLDPQAGQRLCLESWGVQERVLLGLLAANRGSRSITSQERLEDLSR